MEIKHHIITDSFTQIQKQQKRVDNMNLKKIDYQLVTSTYWFSMFTHQVKLSFPDYPNSS